MRQACARTRSMLKVELPHPTYTHTPKDDDQVQWLSVLRAQQLTIRMRSVLRTYLARRSATLSYVASQSYESSLRSNTRVRERSVRPSIHPCGRPPTCRSASPSSPCACTACCPPAGTRSCLLSLSRTGDWLMGRTARVMVPTLRQRMTITLRHKETTANAKRLL